MTIEAIDVSWFNGTISWPRVPQPLAIIRATNGLDVTVEGLNASVDINYAANIAAARAAGKTVGSYHVVDVTKSITQQVDLFLGVAQGTGLLVLDVEHSVQSTSTAVAVKAWINAAIALIQNTVHRTPLVYCDLSTFEWLGSPGEWTLWLADAGVSVPGAPCMMWQYSQGLVAGVNTTTDFDRWMGTLVQLHTMTGDLQVNVNKPPVAILSSKTGDGYGIVCSDGGVFSFGDFVFYGSAGAIKLNAPVVTAAMTPSGAGYYLVGSDGGVFTYGDAVFYGSTGDLKLVAPINDIEVSPSGKGYRLLAADGGVFCFGDAVYFGRVVVA